MAAFTAKDVQALRERTNVGMMDCKKALVEADGDVEKAIEILREKGLASAAKKASRVAAEGIVVALYCDKCKVGSMVEINCETDFVAKNEEFVALAKDVAKTVIKANPADVAALAATKIDGTDVTVEDGIQNLFLKIREKMTLRRFARAEGHVATYIHAGGTVGVMVEFDTDDATAEKEEFKAMGKNIAMQIAAMSPEFLAKSDISSDELAKMKSIIVESSLNKPDTLPKPILTELAKKAIDDKLWSDEDIAAYEEQKNNKFLFNFLSKEAVAVLAELAVANKEKYVDNKIFAGAVEGRLGKQIKEICLLEQAFVRSDLFEGNVGGYVADVAKKLGADIKVKAFTRYAKGEGIEKKADDFAAEVASMVK